METKEIYLYKIRMKEWNSPGYVAAESQQEAIDKVADDYAEDRRKFNVEFVDMVTV
jgi:DNA-dependent RNA polymerase auxiliary subunit epsilon